MKKNTTMKKHLIHTLGAVLSVLVLASCSDFFSPKTDDILSSDDYISSQTEVYTGYIGIITRLQAVGDKSIYLTDTRGELLEPSENSIPELIALYNYNADLSGNDYADPAAYYEVVVACNDYLANMREFRQTRPELTDDDRFDALESLTLRVKVWAYLTLAEIYGQAVWFDDPLVKVQDLSDGSKFQLLQLEAVVDRCMNLLDNGDESTDYVNGTLSFSWYEWLDPETPLADSDYRYWDYMTPPYEGLMAKLCLWKGACLQGNNDYNGAKAYYQQCADLMFDALNEVISDQDKNYYYLPTAATAGNYPRLWDNVDPHAREVVSAIIYDYTRNQTNQLLYHFSKEYPNKYLLRPSSLVLTEYFENNAFNPGYTSSSEKRNSTVFGDRYSDQPYLAKYRPAGSTRRVNAYQDDVHIYLFRATEYHFFLMEALTCLGRFEATDRLLNLGLQATDFVTDADGMVKDDNGYGTPLPGFEGFTNDWTNTASWGTRKYPHVGERGAFSLKARELATDNSDLYLQQNMKANNLAILDEAMLEFAGEGKVYPMYIRTAIRWNDPAIISSRVAVKYGDKAETMKPIIEEQYFVPWDLKLK